MKRKQTSRFSSLLLGIVLVFCMTSTAFAADYNDVADSTWYHAAVDYVTERNLMAGIGGGNFEPETPMTRAMLVTVLHRIEGSPAISGNGGFTDITDGSYYTTAVAWAGAYQIVNGADGKFAPDSLITREQFATILYRYAEAKGYDTSAYAAFDGYSDASQISSYAETAMHWAVGSQILRGSSGRLTPSGSATRAQAATLLMRLMENISEEPAEPTVPSQPTEPEQAAPTVPAQPEEEMITMDIKVGNATFTATLENNDTAKAFVAQLPLTVDMSELNGNEKYNYLSSNLRADTPSSPGTINEGDLMLYGNNCLVLFYKTFNTSYSYVKLGHIDNTTGLAETVGSGSIQVTFSMGN